MNKVRIILLSTLALFHAAEVSAQFSKIDFDSIPEGMKVVQIDQKRIVRWFTWNTLMREKKRLMVWETMLSQK